MFAMNSMWASTPRRNRVKLLVVFTCVSIALAKVAVACACCADPGHRENLNLPITEYELDVLSDLEPNGPANLITTSCGLACVSQLKWQSESADVEFQVVGDQFAIFLNQGTDALTVLKGKLPKEMNYIAVDDNPNGISETVWLGTEFVLPIALYGSGPGWNGGQNIVSSELTFYGSGNACPDFSMIDIWVLQAKASEQHAEFELIGKLHPDP